MRSRMRKRSWHRTRKPLPKLRDLLDRLLVEHLKAQETEALARAAADPAAIDRYRMINARRMSLEKRRADLLKA